MTNIQKSSCLVICARPISSRASQAGDKCAYHFIKDLSQKYDVELFLIINQSDDLSENLVDDLGVKSLHVYRIGRLEKLFLIIRNLLLGIPFRYGTRFKQSILQEIQQKISTGHFAEIYYEFSQCATYHSRLKLPDKIDSVLSIHDLQIQVSLRAKLFEALVFSWLIYRFEKQLLSAMDKLVVLCDKDKKLIEGLYQHRNIEVRPPPLSDFVYQVHRTPERIEKYSMIFWGALARSENEEAAWFLVEQVFPQVKEKFPEAKLYLVGSQPSDRLQKSSSESIIVTGFVDNPEPFFSYAQIGVLPLMRGAGIKLKTLEMLECGIPVVTTDIGAEGVSDNDLLRVVALDKVVETVVNIFADTAD